MPIAGAMQCPAVLSNTFLAHRRGSESCAQPRCWWLRRRAKNALHLCRPLDYADHRLKTGSGGSDRCDGVGIIKVPPEMREACRSVENDREWLTLELSRPVRVRTRNPKLVTDQSARKPPFNWQQGDYTPAGINRI